MKKLFFLISLIASLFLPNILKANNFFSPIQRIKSEKVNVERKIDFNDENVLVFSIKVFANKVQLPDSLYSYDYSGNYLELDKEFVEKNITIEYQVLPKTTITNYYFYEVVTTKDTTIVRPRSNLNKRFFTNSQSLSIVGNKSISIAVGNNEDLDINQSLYLRIQGKLTDQMNVQAQLSDSQSPISPEGDSKELSTLDQIFIRLYGKSYELAFGELELPMTNYKFMEYTPKFEGVKFTLDKKYRTSNAIAISKGKNNVSNFNGIDAVQGPYYLANSEADSDNVKIISGTEKIYLNGILLSRGTDYYIDYDEGSITFTSKHFINSKSKIRAIYQYSDENYKQNIYVSDNYLPIFSKLSFNLGYIQQDDDKANPLAEDLSEDDKEFLKNGGDEIIISNGIFESESGDYILIDAGEISFYEYVPPIDGEQQGTHTLVFTRVEAGTGDYIQEGNHYIFVSPLEGEGGDFIIGKSLVAPQKKQNFATNFKYIGDNIVLDSEILISNHDKNTYSTIDDGDNIGYIYDIRATYKPSWDNLSMRFISDYENKSKNLEAFADIQDAQSLFEFDNFYDTDSLSYESVTNSISFANTKKDSIILTYQYRDLKDHSLENYYKIDWYLNQRKFLPNITNNSLIMRQRRDGMDINKVNYFREYLTSSYNYSWFTPSFEFYHKENSVDRELQDTGDKNTKYNYNLSTNYKNLFLSEIFYENDRYFDKNSSWRKTSDFQTYGLLAMIQQQNHYLNLDMKQMRTKYFQTSDEEKLDNNVELAKINSSNAFLDKSISVITDYSLENTQTYPKEKKLIYVGVGQGPYNSEGEDVGYNDPDSGYDYEYNNVGDPELTIHMIAAAQFSFIPRNFKGFNKNDILSRFSFETSISIDELSTSKDKWKLYLLSPDVLFNNETSQTSSMIYNSKFWYEFIKRKLNFMFHYNKDKTMDTLYEQNLETGEDFTKYEDYSEAYLYELQLYKIRRSNFVVSYKKENIDNYLYKTFTKRDQYQAEVNTSFSRGIIFYSTFTLLIENARNTETSEIKNFKSFVNKDVFKTSLGRKYYMNFTFEPSYNFDDGLYSGSSVSKVKGFHFSSQISLTYDINNYTRMSFLYNGDIVPNKDYSQRFEIEMTAEF